MLLVAKRSMHTPIAIGDRFARAFDTGIRLHAVSRRVVKSKQV